MIEPDGTESGMRAEPDMAEPDMAEAYNRAGADAFAAARYDEAEDLYEAGLDAAIRAASDPDRADALFGLARVAARRGGYPDADALFGRARGCFERLGDIVRAADCMVGIAGVAADQGRHAHAETMYLAALDRYPADAVRDIARCRLSLSELLNDTGRCTEAERVARDAARGFVLSKDWAALADCALGITEARVRGGDSTSAETMLIGLSDTFRGFDLHDKVAECAAALAATVASVGRTDEAIAHYRSALNTFERLGLVDEAAECMYHLARLTSPADAASYVRRARERFTRLGQVIDVARTDLAAAGILAARPGLLAAALDIAIPAVLYVDSQRFQFRSTRARLRWSSTVEREMAVVFGWAHRLGDPHLLAELVEVDINFGMPRSVRAATPSIRATHRESRAAARVVRAGSTRLAADAYLPMTVGPRIRMPDGRIALDRYFDLMLDRYGLPGEPPPARAPGGERTLRRWPWQLVVIR